jgi:hypothetical protein
LTATQRILRFSALYAGIVFCAGFVLGVIRVLWLTPGLGPLGAVALELPVILGLSWVVCARLLRPPLADWTKPHLLATGTLGFALLIGMELALGALLNGDGVTGFLAGLATPQGALGLAGQIAFGLIPLIQAGTRQDDL